MLVEQWHTHMIRLAKHYVAQQEVAEEVVQETWLGIWRGLTRFEHRSSLKTWIFHILTNQAKLRAKRETHAVSFSDAFPLNESEQSVDSNDLFASDGGWTVCSKGWPNDLDAHILEQEMHSRIQQAVQILPPIQALVLTLHDLEGWSASEICVELALSAENQRVLLHRPRAKVRQRLAQYFGQ